MKERSDGDSILEPVRERAPRRPVSVVQRTDDALRVSELRYRRLFESAQDGILILDADSGEVIDVNPYLAGLLGYERAEFIGKQLWDLGPLEDVAASQAAYRELQARDYVAYEDLPLQTAGGKQVDVGFVSNVYLVGGKRVIQCNIRDITARKRVEAARRSLEHKQRASQKMEAISGLAGGIAHDFGHLLSAILSFTSFALETLPGDSVLKHDLCEAERAVGRASTLHHHLLAVSSKQLMRPVLLDLNQVIVAVEKVLHRILGDHIQLVHLFAPDLGLTLADEGQIGEVFMSLVMNALDAMPRGGRLTIVTENVEIDDAFAASRVDAKAGSYVMLAVTDTGHGMDAQTRARAFEPFFTTKQTPARTGLGLSTVYGIVKQSGGSTWVYSIPGRGTRVEIYLPREHPTIVSIARGLASRVTRPPHGRETLLLVEDEDAARSSAERILISAGYTVLCATTGREALRLLQTHDQPLPLVLTDVVMTHLGGRAFVAELRRLRPGTLVLFMFGHSDDGGLHDDTGLESGTRFIARPFEPVDLVLEVRAMLDNARVAVPAAAT